MLLHKKNSGFLTAELVVAFVIIATLMSGLIMSLYAIGQFNSYQLIRQQCTAAAQAQIDSLTATGQPIKQDDFQRLWPDISFTITTSDGSGQWKNMKYIEVAAKGQCQDREVIVNLYRYLSSEKGQ